LLTRFDGINCPVAFDKRTFLSAAEVIGASNFLFGGRWQQSQVTSTVVVVVVAEETSTPLSEETSTPLSLI
jgi:hypothetical protein